MNVVVGSETTKVVGETLTRCSGIVSASTSRDNWSCEKLTDEVGHRSGVAATNKTKRREVAIRREVRPYTRVRNAADQIDLFHPGLIDHLVIGREVETNWEPLLDATFGVRD